MSGRQLLEAAPYGAETLGVLFEAFDGARAEVKSQVSELPHKAEIARMSLATIILDLARSGMIGDADHLKDIAVRTFRASGQRTPS